MSLYPNQVMVPHWILKLHNPTQAQSTATIRGLTMGKFSKNDVEDEDDVSQKSLVDVEEFRGESLASKFLEIYIYRGLSTMFKRCSKRC